VQTSIRKYRRRSVSPVRETFTKVIFTQVTLEREKATAITRKWVARQQTRIRKK
jgi:hypothetical protein